MLLRITLRKKPLKLTDEKNDLGSHR